MMRTTIYLILFLFLMFSQLSFGQSDENSFIINEYFQTNNEFKDSNLSLNRDTSSYVILNQIGNQNIINLTTDRNDTQRITQQGNQNNYENYTYKSNQQSNKTINQEGNLNSLLIFGENSLMKNLIINQKADFQSIVIKNYTN